MIDGPTTFELSAHVVLRGAELVVIEGKDAGLRHVLLEQRTVIGCDAGATMRLTDPTVSRFHCEIVLGEGEALVRDLHSVNGTIVDGVTLSEAFLEAGQVLSLGLTRIAVQSASEPVRLELSPSVRFGRLVGTSASMRRVFRLLERAAASDNVLLIEGETGTGKELAARSVHEKSARASGPLVIVDCGAIPPQLLESELLGHDKGAFTGAVNTREGAFEAADGGTVFLDELGELPLDLQPKLLRVLERREIKRLGSTRVRPVDVRVIAATNRDLQVEVNAKRFRSDLYYRLAVVKVRLPSLRECPDDLPMIVEEILDRLGVADTPAADTLRTADLRAELVRHRWPGNGRELRNWVERCLAMRMRLSPSDDDPADADGALEEALEMPLRSARERWTELFERRYLRDLLATHGGNVAAAARAASVGRTYLYRLLARHGLTRDQLVE